MNILTYNFYNFVTHIYIYIYIYVIPQNIIFTLKVADENQSVNVTCKRLNKDDREVNEIINDDQKYEKVIIMYTM